MQYNSTLTFHCPDNTSLISVQLIIFIQYTLFFPDLSRGVCAVSGVASRAEHESICIVCIVVEVVVVVALRRDCQVHFQQEAGVRLFMQQSFKTFRERGKTGYDGGEAQAPLSAPPQPRNSLILDHNHLPRPLHPNSYRARG